MKLKNTNRGSILIAVLWSLFFLAALALVINALITPQLTLAQRLRERVMLRTFASAGMKKSIVEIRADETEGFDALNDSWSSNEEAFKEIALTDGGYFSVEYTTGDDKEEEGETYYGLIDEERKININTASADVLKKFFEIAGEASSQQASDISDSIIDWRDDDDEPETNGAEDGYYTGLDPSYNCKNSKFEILEELLLVREMTQEIFDKVKDHLTIFGKGKVNINTADKLVLLSLGMRDSLAEKVIQFRQGDDGTPGTLDDNIFESAGDAPNALSTRIGLYAEEVNEFTAIVENGIVGVSSDFFRGHSFGRTLDSGTYSKVVFVIDRDENVRYWREH